MRPVGIPAASAALLALLLEALRDAVLAHCGLATATGAVGTAVGTDDNAAESLIPTAL